MPANIVFFFLSFELVRDAMQINQGFNLCMAQCSLTAWLRQWNVSDRQEPNGVFRQYLGGVDLYKTERLDHTPLVR